MSDNKKSCCENSGINCCESECASSTKNSSRMNDIKNVSNVEIITDYYDNHDHAHGHTHSIHSSVTMALKSPSSCCDSGGECCEKEDDLITTNIIHNDKSCCGEDHGHSSHDHGSSFSHDHQSEEPCCGDEHCRSSSSSASYNHNHEHSTHQHTTHDHDHKHSSSASERSLSVTAITIDVSSDMVHLLDKKCNSCDPSSVVPHAIQVTRFRIANLCCGSEERLILSTLQGLHGVEKVDVNVVGRYAVVKHCPVECCAPASKIAEKLNEHRLGASVNEAFGEERTDDDDGVSYLEIIHAVVVFALFIVGVIVQQVSVDGAYSSMIVFLISTAFGLLPVIKAAYISLTRFTLDIHVLMIVATVGAIADQEYLDASLLMSLFVMAELTEDFVMVRVSRAVRLNTGSMPKRAVLSNGKSTLLEDVQVGDILAVRAGEMILADGVVLKGESVIDESALTGEAKPLPKKKGDKVSSGTIVQNGYLEVSVEARPSDSTMNKLRDAVLDVQADKGEYGRMVDRISVYWTPGILFSALCLAVIGGGVTSQWNEYAMKALVLLVLACPCALVVAAPIPSVCSIAAAARKNVLVRGSSVIEKAGLVTIVALDKTGTVVIVIVIVIVTTTLYELVHVYII